MPPPSCVVYYKIFDIDVHFVFVYFSIKSSNRPVHDGVVLDLQLPVESLPITTNFYCTVKSSYL